MKKSFNRIKTIQDVVDWGLCVGCGACEYICDKSAVSLHNIPSVGIRPQFKGEACRECNDCLSICPGYNLNANNNYKHSHELDGSSLLIGPSLEIWEGHANDEEIRFSASSGGILSALSLYCLEKENMNFVLHTGMDDEAPWANKTVISRNKTDLLMHTGSRYAPSSPCADLTSIEHSETPCVFVGKPCDAAAVSLLRAHRPQLDGKLGLVLTFFCAGTPNTRGSLELIKQMGINPDEVNSVRYRGDGWPGSFNILYNGLSNLKSITYKESWSFLQKYRSFRCNLCPDGLGEFADISCGDAWHRFPDGVDKGQSIVMVRSERGREILHKAMEAGYLDLTPCSADDVLKAQGLPQRRKELFERLLAMRMLLIPTPRAKGMPLQKVWLKNSPKTQARTILGTLMRLLQRGL